MGGSNSKIVHSQIPKFVTPEDDPKGMFGNIEKVGTW
jgi:hypothetical protein